MKLLMSVIFILVSVVNLFGEVNNSEIITNDVNMSKSIVMGEVNQSIKSTQEIELEVVSKLSEFMGASLTGFTNQISHLLMMFQAIVTLLIAVISVVGYIKFRNLSDSIDKNRQFINDYKESIDNKLLDYKENMDEKFLGYKENMDNKLLDYKKEVKQEIVEEVKQQIVYGLDEAILKVQEHAYKKVEYTVNQLTGEIQKRRFYYQKLIYKVNQVKKYEYEAVMKDDITIEEKLKKVLSIQSKYNEINNSDIPKLFSKSIEENVIPAATKLSEYKGLTHIVTKLLLKALENDDLNYVQRTQVKDVLRECYNWEEDKNDTD